MYFKRDLVYIANKLTRWCAWGHRNGQQQLKFSKVRVSVARELREWREGAREECKECKVRGHCCPGADRSIAFVCVCVHVLL